MKKSLANKYGSYAIITGATSGIGAEFADQVAADGMNLVIVARRKNLLVEKAFELTEKYGVDVKTVQADLSKSEDLEKVFEATKNLEIGLLIPNAGLEVHGVMTENNIEQEMAMIQLNVSSVFAMTHHFGRLMSKRGRGGILLVSSLLGHMPSPYFSNYSATKSYILQLGQSLQWEMQKKGVDVTVLSPGLTSTPMADGLTDSIDFSKTPMDPMSPGETARLALQGLGKKAVVVPGAKNNFVVFMTKHLAGIGSAIKMSGKMMDNALVS